MIKSTNYIRLWRDRTLLYFPIIPKRRGRLIRLGIDQLPWSAGKKLPVGPSYRIMLGIIPRHPILSAMIPIVLPNLQAPTLGYGKTFIAQFAVDHRGIPHPASACIHMALTTIKTVELTGRSARAKDFMHTQAEFVTKIARHERPIDDEKLRQLIQWLQGYLPRGCDIMPEILIDTQTPDETNSIMQLMPVTIRQAVISSLQRYSYFLQGSDRRIVTNEPHRLSRTLAISRLWPTAANTPLPSYIDDLIYSLRMNIRTNVNTVLVLTKHTVPHRTTTVCEVAALHLIENARLMLTCTTFRKKDIGKWPGSFNNINTMGLTVFSDDTAWLDELQACFSMRGSEDARLSVPPLAKRNPITPRDYLAAIRQLEGSKLASLRKRIWTWAVGNPLTLLLRRMITGTRPHPTAEIKKAFGHITARNLLSDPLSVTEAISALRTYAKRCAPYYRHVAEEYARVAHQQALPSYKHQRRANLYKRLSVITPIRLTTFTDGHKLLNQLRTASLGLAIVDCSGKVSTEQIALICTRFQHVVLIAPDRKRFNALPLPPQVDEALRQRHGITSLPFISYPSLDD